MKGHTRINVDLIHHQHAQTASPSNQMIHSNMPI